MLEQRGTAQPRAPGCGNAALAALTALQELLLQPHGDPEMEFGPGTAALLRHLDRAITDSPLSPQSFTSALFLCEFSAGAGQARGWVSVVFSVFSP